MSRYLDLNYLFAKVLIILKGKTDEIKNKLKL